MHLVAREDDQEDDEENAAGGAHLGRQGLSVFLNLHAERLSELVQVE